MGASSWVAHDGNGTVGGAADNCERWRNGITFNGPDYPSTTYTTPVTVGHADRCGLNFVWGFFALFIVLLLKDLNFGCCVCVKFF